MEVTESGIIIAQESDSKRREELSEVEGILVAVGADAWRDRSGKYNPWAKIGQRVTYARFAGKVLTDPDDPENEYFVMNDEDIIAIIPPKETNK